MRRVNITRFGLMVGLLLGFVPQVAASHGEMTEEVLLVDEELAQLTETFLLEEARCRQEWSLLSADQRAQCVLTLTELAHERVRRLVELAHEAPEVSLRRALPAAYLQGLSPELQAALERHTSPTGQMEVLIETDFTENTLRAHYRLKPPSGDSLTLHFAGEPPSLRSGDQVQAHGVQLVEHLVLGEGAPATTMTIIGPTNVRTTGRRTVLPILVNFLNRQEQPFTPAQVTAALEETSRYFRENSYQQLELVIAPSLGWYTLPMTLDATCPYNRIFDEAMKAAAADADLSAFNHLVVVMPPDGYEFCKWAGLGTLGEPTFVTPDGSITAGKIWINYPVAGVFVYVHELGHNLGLPHANALDCPGAPLLETGCTHVEYGDPFDVMGSGNSGYWIGHVNIAYKEHLKWLSPANILLLEAGVDSGTYALEFLEAPSTRLQGLKIILPPTTLAFQTTYYVSYRQPVGFGTLPQDDRRRFDGAMIHRILPQFPNQSVNDTKLLDMTPDVPPDSVTGSDFYDRLDSRLPLGAQFTDPISGLTIRTVGLGGATINVQVQIPKVCPSNGDVNQDGTRTPGDARLILQYLNDPAILTPCQKDQGDVTLDYDLTEADAQCIFDWYLGKPSCFGTQPPAAPLRLTVKGVTRTTVQLGWQASPDQVESYQLVRQGPEGERVFGSIPALAMSHTDTNLLAGTTYTYRLRAISVSGVVSADSNEVSATTTDFRPQLYFLRSTLQGPEFAIFPHSFIETYTFEVCRGRFASPEPCTTLPLAIDPRRLDMIDTTATPGVVYTYRARAKDATGVSSSYSNRAVVAVFSDDPLTPRVTKTQARHLLELRQAVTAFRTAAGLSAPAWAEAVASGVIVRASHFTELQDRLVEARQILVGGTSTTLPPLTPRQTRIEAVHVQTLRKLMQYTEEP